MIDVRSLIGTHDVLLVTLDTLRYDVAQRLYEEGRTPNLARVLKWEKRHSPANFTYPAHQAFFAGFFPTPASPGKHQRPLAVNFPGSESIGERTYVFNAPDIVAGFASIGYRTICVGGVGFFNKSTPLGAALPSLFQESHWNPSLGVNDPESTENQIALIGRILPKEGRVFLFLNISAIHHPNRIYLPGAEKDSIESHAAALEYVDRQIPKLFALLRRPTFGIICSDHGTAYGEEGFEGHRLGHPAVWTVPYAEFLL